MRKRNWREYNKQLIHRESLTFIIDPKLIKIPQKISGKNGRPLQFTNEFIVMLMMVKIHYRLSYRALQGFMEHILRLYGYQCGVPSYSLICKRAASLQNQLPTLSYRRPQVVLLDASGMKVFGEGEWKVKMHGKSKRRKWIKIHIAVDAQTQEVVAVTTTSSAITDREVAETLLNDVKGKRLKTVCGDGAYDSVRKVIKEKNAKGLVPPPKNARINGIDEERDDAVKIIRGLGGDKHARSLWDKLTGYSIRALAETASSRLKRLFGERLFSKVIEKQSVENYLRCYLLNKMQKNRAMVC